SDPAIIGLPALLRLPLARLIASRRSRVAAEIYAHLGGASPLLANTKAQARALEAELGPDDRCFIAMRYWHPLTAATVAEVKAWQPDEIVLLPLYPQFSTTTTASSLAAWRSEAARQGLRCSGHQSRRSCAALRQIGSVSWSRRFPSFPSIPRPWSSSIAITGLWRTATVCRFTTGPRPSAPIRGLSERSPNSSVKRPDGKR